jgi:hypothetical protein
MFLESKTIGIRGCSYFRQADVFLANIVNAYCDEAVLEKHLQTAWIKSPRQFYCTGVIKVSLSFFGIDGNL